MIGVCPRIRLRFLPSLQSPCECAEERSFKRIRASDCLSEASSSSTPLEASTGRCPQRSGGSQAPGSPFFSLGFFGETKKSKSPAAAIERHRNFAECVLVRSKQEIRERVFSRSEPKFAVPSARPAGAALRYAAKLRSDPENQSPQRPQLKCFPTIPANSNIVTCAFPNTGNSFASALIARLFAASCSFSALM